jgi:L-lysine exporter family protein LysE/ArgO
MWLGFLLCLSLCLDLGVVNLAILRASLRHGGSAGFLIGLGSCAGDLVYFALSLAGAAAVLRWTPVRWALWLFGTGVLLFLAWRMARDVIHPRPIAESDALPTPDRPPQLLMMGVGLALASPTSILWFAAVGGSVIASSGAATHSVFAFGAGFALAGIVWSAAFAYSAATLRRWMGDSLVRGLSLVSALLFLYFAGVIFMDGLRRL